MQERAGTRRGAESGTGAGDPRLTVAVVSSRARRRAALSRAIARCDGLRVVSVGSARELAILRENGAAARSAKHGAAPAPDCVVIDEIVEDASPLALAANLRGQGVGVVLARTNDGIEAAVAAMRAGVSDILLGTVPPPDAGERVMSAAAVARRERDRAVRIVKLKRLCRRLDASRRDLARQARVLCTDLVLAYEELSRHMSTVGTATEYQGLIRGELDIESLLRTTLEFVLSRSGPTNAAVFLPTTSGDYSLGAYVNYDCPKDTCDILLDHLANVIAPRFEDAREPLHLTHTGEMERYIGGDAEWLGDSHVIALACKADTETLAIVMLFRDHATPYPESLLEQVRTVGDLFARQLARVIRIHHRHLPKDKWGMLGDADGAGEDGFDDLAA